MTVHNISGPGRLAPADSRTSPVHMAVTPGGRALPRGEDLQREATRIVSDIERAAGAADRLIQFDIDAETERVIVRLIDRGTGDVIRQVPPDQVLSIIASINRLLGLFLDERV